MDELWAGVVVEKGNLISRTSSSKSSTQLSNLVNAIQMDYNLRAMKWMILILFTLPLLKCSGACPQNCFCNGQGAAMCVGPSITDIPKGLPAHTYLLQINSSNMDVINEQSLKNMNLLLRFSLINSHLHNIHPMAFHVAPQLMSVKLSSNDLSTLPARVFSPLSALEQLHLDGNKLETIAPDMFEGLTGLVDMDLSRNALTKPTSDVFKGLSSLQFLNLGRNSIKTLPRGIFHSLTNLRQLMLYNNELEELQPGMFDGLVNLMELKIHHNKIASLPPRLFWPLGNLLTLTLSSNQLQYVPEKSFYYMPNLRKLTLYNNPLLSLPDQLMGHMPNINEFYLYATDLTTVPGNLFANMSGLVRLNLHINKKLRYLPSDLFCCLPNLDKLSLKSNDLHHLPSQLFSSLPTLRILHLHDNKLQNLPNDMFKGLKRLHTLDLRNNQLRSLQKDIFSGNFDLRFLTLSENPWDCTCSIQGIATWIQRNKHVVMDNENVECHTPVYQLLRTLSSLHDGDFETCDNARVTTSNPSTDGLDTHVTEGPTVMMAIQTTTFPTTTPLTEPKAITIQTTPSTTKMPLMETQPITIQATTSLTTMPSTVTQPIAIQTTPSRSPQPPTTTKPNGNIIPRVASSRHPSQPFHNKFVMEQRPEFVHHNRFQNWVYVWFLPSNVALTGFLLVSHILLMVIGLFFILAAIFGLYHLNKAMGPLTAQYMQIMG